MWTSCAAVSEKSDKKQRHGSILNSAHLGNTDSNGLALSGHEDDLLVGVNAGIVPQQTGKHQLGAVADGVDSRVLDDKALVRAEERLERLDDLAQVRLVAAVVVLPLGIENIVQRD